MPEGVTGILDLVRNVTAIRTLVGIYAAFLGVYGTAQVVLGGHDIAFAPGGLDVAAFGLIAFVAGLAQVAAAICLVRALQRPWPTGRRPSASPIVPLAFAGGAIIAVYVVVTALRTADHNQPVVLVGLVLLVVSLSGLTAFARDVRTVGIRIGGIALGLLGTVAGIGQFWYANDYTPSHVGRGIVLTTHIARVSKDKGLVAVRASIEAENVGNSSVLVLGSAYSFTGQQLVRCFRSSTVKRVAGVFSGQLADPQAVRFTRYVRNDQPRLIAAGKFLGDGLRLDPGQTLSKDFIFYVPAEAFQLLAMRAQVFVIRSDIRLGIATDDFRKPVLDPDDGNSYEFWRVDDRSWLHALISGPNRWIAVRYEFGNPDHPQRLNPTLRANVRFPAPTWGDSPPSVAATAALFASRPLGQTADASEPFSDAEMPLAEVPEATPALAEKYHCETP